MDAGWELEKAKQFVKDQALMGMNTLDTGREVRHLFELTLARPSSVAPRS